MDIHKLNDNLQKLNFDQLVGGVFTLTEKEIVETNREQLNYGFDAENGQMPYYKTKKYAEFKRGLGSVAGGRVDLKLKYDFQRLMKTKQTAKTVSVISTDRKTKWQEKRYGKDKIFGLNSPNTEKYAFNDFLPVFNEMLKREMLRT